VDSGIASLNIQRLPIGLLQPHPKNPRKHPNPGSKEWQVLKASLEHDYFDPVVWNERNQMLVSGHLRVRVFKEMGITAVDAVVVDYDEPTHVARMMAANKAFGVNDKALMKSAFAELVGVEGFDLDLTGFADFEMAAFGFDPDATGPEFDFNGENQDTAANGADNPYGVSTDATAEQRGNIRYFQLIYGAVDYDRFKQLVEEIKIEDSDALTEKYQERAGEMPNILIHVLETYANMRRGTSGTARPARPARRG
jgi:hypothetical protein